MIPALVVGHKDGKHFQPALLWRTRVGIHQLLYFRESMVVLSFGMDCPQLSYQTWFHGSDYALVAVQRTPS